MSSLLVDVHRYISEYEMSVPSESHPTRLHLENFGDNRVHANTTELLGCYRISCRRLLQPTYILAYLYTHTYIYTRTCESISIGICTYYIVLLYYVYIRIEFTYAWNRNVYARVRTHSRHTTTYPTGYDINAVTTCCSVPRKYEEPRFRGTKRFNRKSYVFLACPFNRCPLTNSSSTRNLDTRQFLFLNQRVAFKQKRKKKNSFTSRFIHFSILSVKRFSMTNDYRKSLHDRCHVLLDRLLASIARLLPCFSFLFFFSLVSLEQPLEQLCKF